MTALRLPRWTPSPSSKALPLPGNLRFLDTGQAHRPLNHGLGQRGRGALLTSSHPPLAHSLAECGFEAEHPTNRALNIAPVVDSECYTSNPTSKTYLTDGNTLSTCPGDQQYWHSCDGPAPRTAQVDLPYAYCVRQVKVYARCDCCQTQAEGAVAEVLTAKGWEQCGGTPTSYPSAMALSCALLGTAVRIRADRTTALTLAEIEVFAEARMPFFLVHVWHGGALRCGGGGGYGRKLPGGVRLQGAHVLHKDGGCAPRAGRCPPQGW